jgi:hypothetical protein
MPILRSFGDVRQGTISRDAFTLLWNEAFEQVKEIATQQELVFGATRIWKQWEKLIQLAAKTQGALHLVSDDDLKFWEDSSDPLSPAWNYRSALKDFPGVKWRVLVIDPTRLREADFPEQLIHVVTAMIDEDRFRVSIADKNDITPDTETDFGIIADIAVSRFVSKGSRTLIERFSREEINRARKHWESILTARKWDSEESRQPVETWVAKSR